MNNEAQADTPDNQSGAEAISATQTATPPGGASGEPASKASRTEKLAEQRFESSRQLAAGSNKVFLAFFVSLVLMWFEIVMPKVQEIVNARDIAQGRMGFIKSRGLIRSPANRTPGTGVQTYVSEAQEYASNVSNEDTVALPFGNTLHHVKKYLSPLIWTFAALVLLIYLDLTRHRYFELIGRGLSILKNDLGYKSTELVDSCLFSPWWLAPFPVYDGKRGVTVQEFRTAIGLATNARYKIVAASLALSSIFGIQLFTLWVTWKTLVLFGPEDRLAKFLYLEITLLLFLLTIVCGIDWLWPKEVPDIGAGMQNPNAWGRRQFVASGGWLLLGLLFYPALNSILRITRPLRFAADRTPRFKRKKEGTPVVQSATLSTNGLLNPKSGVLRYVSPSAMQQTGLRGLSSFEGFVAVDFASTVLHPPMAKYSRRYGDPLPFDSPAGDGRNSNKIRLRSAHLDPRFETWAIESAVDELLKKNPKDPKACELLTYVLENGSLSLRLFDRLAVLTVQKDLPKVRERLIQIAEKHVQQLSAEAQASHLPKPVTSWQRLYSAMGIRQSSHLRRLSPSERRKCRGGELLARKRQTPEVHPYRNIKKQLERRVAAWKNKKGRWFIKWSANNRTWQAPIRAKACSRRRVV
jgi:hypothetical protein